MTGLRREVAEVLREHRLILGIVALYLAAAYAVQARLFPGMMRGMWYLPSYLMFIIGAVASWPPMLVYRRWQIRDAQGRRVPAPEGWQLAWRSLRDELLRRDRVLRLVFVAFLVPLFLSTFGRWKFIMQYVHPFAWDVRLSELDRGIHFGRYPWMWLQPVMGHPLITRIVDFAYVPVLLCMLIGVVVWQGWTADRQLRQRFLLTFVLAWILLGTVSATILSSAGPCYYGRVTGLPDPYAPLMHYLNVVHQATPLIARQAQEVLWASFQQENNVPFSGISAMPSIHVAMPMLFALVGWRAHPRLGRALTAFAVVMFLGSVHLGWHYAVDGYASALGLAAIWKLSGRLASV